MRKGLLIFALLLLLATVGVVAGHNPLKGTPEQRIAKPDSGGEGQKKPQSQPSDQNAKGAVPPSPRPAAQICDEACQQARENLQIQERLAWFTGLLVIVGALQVGTMIGQACLLKRTREDVHTQAEWMKTQAGHMNDQTQILRDSVAVAKIGADATRESVESSRDATKRQLRAYLAVTVGSAAFQNRPMNQKFEGGPNILNKGQTPARKVTGKIQAAILPSPLPRGTVLPDPREEIWESTIGAQQSNTVSAVVDEFCDDAEVEVIKSASGKALYVWGVVTYLDTFGDTHRTRFAQSYEWRRDGTMFGTYIPNHNDAD